MDKLGRVFLSFVKEVEAVCENQAPANGFHSTIALNPGIRTCSTMYDADGFGLNRVVLTCRNSLFFLALQTSSSRKCQKQGQLGHFVKLISASFERSETKRKNARTNGHFFFLRITVLFSSPSSRCRGEKCKPKP